MKNLFSVEGKVTLVTGGASGIGKMIAAGYVENGAKVYIASRKKDVCDEVASELSQHGTCTAIQADLSTLDGIKALVSEISAHEERLDVLINNSGANWGAPFDEFPEQGWDKVYAVNVKAPFFLIQQLAPLLRASGSAENPARVINIASINGLTVPELETYSYSSSKAAVIHLTRHLARRLASEHITVNAIAPGPFQSRMMRETIEKFGDQILAETPLHRLGEPEDAAGVSIFLGSRASSYLTGACIPMDGGRSTTV